MTARKAAERDIKQFLKIQGKCFLTFHEELNPIMDELVNQQIKAQELCNTTQQ